MGIKSIFEYAAPQIYFQLISSTVGGRAVELRQQMTILLLAMLTSKGASRITGAAFIGWPERLLRCGRNLFLIRQLCSASTVHE